MSRRIEALRALAERPGTHAEGEVARAKLARALAHKGDLSKQSPWDAFRSYLRTGSMDDLRWATTHEVCQFCGLICLRNLQCPHTSEHYAEHSQLRDKFPRGTRVYYNYWAYSENCPAVVTGYSAELGRIRLKFDHLKNSRSVPIYQDGELRLFTEPIDHATAFRMAHAV